MKKIFQLISASFFLLLSITTYAQITPKKSTVIISESEIISLSNILKKYSNTVDLSNNDTIPSKSEIDLLNTRITLLTELLAAQKKPVAVSKIPLQKTTLSINVNEQPTETVTLPSKEMLAARSVDSKETEKIINEKKPINNYSDLSALQQEISELKFLVSDLAAKQNTFSTTQVQPTTAIQPAAAEIKTIPKEIIPMPIYTEKIITKTDTVYILKTNDSFKTLDSLNMKLLNVKNNLIKEQQTEIDSLKNQLSETKIVPQIKVEDKIVTTTKKVYFNNNEYSLSELNSSLLDELIVKDSVNSKFQFYLKGYSSSSGNAKYNSVLSKKRTQSVYDYLISKGITAKAIKTESFGVDTSAKNESKARRVEIEVTKIP